VTQRRHLFVGGGTAFGEAVLGLRIADELAARGDEIVVLTQEGMSLLTEGRPFRTEFFSPAAHKRDVDALILRVAAAHKADSIVLVDATVVFSWLKEQGSDATFTRKAPAPVIGLDAWDARETGLVWDVAGTERTQSKHSLDVKLRLVPVPFAHVKRQAGHYNALPAPPTLTPEERDDVRADLGLERDDRLLLLTSARWQHLGLLPDAGRRLATNLPALIDTLLERVGPKVRVVHVGPEPYSMPSLKERYTWLAQRTPTRFAKLLASADLLLTFNFSATTIQSAIAAGLPILYGMSSYAGRCDEIVARLPSPPTGALRAWLERTAPIFPFRVWPIGLHRFLTPLATSNAYTSAMGTAEVLEEHSFVEALRRHLFDEPTRRALRERQAAYRDQVSALPRAADIVDRYLGS